MREKLFFILLLVIWVAHCSLPEICYLYGRFSCRKAFDQSKEMNAKIVSQILLFDDDTKIPWESKGDEILWKNQLYDVVSIQKEKNVTIVNCVNDGMENAIISMYNELSKEDSNLMSNALKRIKLQIAVQYLPEIVYELDKELIREEINTDRHESSWFIGRDIPYPPPEKLLFV